MEVWTLWMFLIFLKQLPEVKAQESECGVAPLNTKIVGGQNATAGSWPWQVSMHLVVASNNFSAHICGGTIVNTEWVLTAAHCIPTTDPTSYLLYFGKQTQSGYNPNEVNRTVSQIIVHPDYNGTTLTNDIALMKLKSSITYNNYIRPACLAANTSLFHNGTTCWGTGWGRLSKDEPNVAYDILQEVQIPVIGNNECKCYYSQVKNAQINSNMICAGELGKGICQGDSGGPIQCKQGSKWIQAGIASFGIPCAIGYPEVFARVSYFQPWITNHTAGTNVSFVVYNSSGTDADSSFVCPLTSTNTTTAPSSRAAHSELAFAGTIAMILLIPLFA